MDGDHRKLGGRLQSLFQDFVKQKNAELGWIRRQRECSAVSLVSLLVFGWIGKATRNFASLAMKAKVSPQALQQRLTVRAVEMFQALLSEALEMVFTARPPLIPLLSRFTGIVVDDSTQLKLPSILADVFPACGGLDGTRGKAGWKLLIRYDVLTGRLYPFDLRPGKTSDRDLSINPLRDLAAGMLYLADLGYFALERLRQVRQAGAHYITRLPARLHVRGSDGRHGLIGAWLKNRRENQIDEEVSIGDRDSLKTRLVAVRVPEHVAAERRRKLRIKSGKRKRTVSDNQLALCDWWVGVTDLPTARLSADEVRTLYGLRWQVELLFKHWKQVGGLGAIHGRTAESVQVEYLAKLVGVIVMHWQELLGGGPLEGKNRMAVHRLVTAACKQLAEALKANSDVQTLVEILETLAAALKKLRRRPCRRKAASSRQRVYGKRLAA